MAAKTPVQEERERRIKSLDSSQLIDLYDRIKEREAIDGWDQGRAFEYLVIRAFHDQGFDVTWPYEVTGAPALNYSERSNRSTVLCMSTVCRFSSSRKTRDDGWSPVLCSG